MKASRLASVNLPEGRVGERDRELRSAASQGPSEAPMSELLIAVGEIEIARLTGLSPDFVGNLVRDRKFPHVRLGRRVVFSIRAVDDFLYKQAMASVEANDPESCLSEASGPSGPRTGA